MISRDTCFVICKIEEVNDPASNMRLRMQVKEEPLPAQPNT